MADPRSANCKAFAKDGGGRVVGIELQYREEPTARYQLMRVDLVDEPTVGVGGPTVATFSVQDQNGIEVPEKVWLAWPWPGLSDGHGLPGNQNRQHVISSRFWPPNIGPLAIFVGDANVNPISDVIGGLGLPEGHHVSFTLTFRERGAVPPVVPPIEGDYSAILDNINAKLDALMKHLGAV